MWDTWIQSLGQEDPLEKEMATHSSNSCLENPINGGGYRPQGYKELTQLSEFTFTFIFDWCIYMFFSDPLVSDLTSLSQDIWLSR